MFKTKKGKEKEKPKTTLNVENFRIAKLMLKYL